MLTGQKEFRFEAAHRLVGNYPGKCRNIHGHSYVAKVIICLRENADLDKFGFVKDYADFKGLKEWIDENLDHATLVSNEDVQLQNILNSIYSKQFIMSYPNSSAEYLCMQIYEKAKTFLEDDRVFVQKVIINETCTSEATVTF